MKKLLIPFLALVLLGGACSRDKDDRSASRANTNVSTDPAITAGLNLSSQRCVGTAKPPLTRLPMNLEDIAMIQPYGLMIGGHVTPIDHQYFSPADFNSAPDTYDVYAMADARIVGIGTRQHPGFGQYKDRTVTDYRLVFTVSCKLLYYYDLVTSLAPDIQAEYEAKGNAIDLPVKSGQLIGKIGGQTLDFAVWDMDVNLTGFVVPEHYVAESWKIHTADPLNYYTDEVKAQALSKYARQAEPRSGKIDYDVDGKLIGNWFKVGTNGYGGVSGNTGYNYWTGHLSFAPDFLAPSGWLISIGNWPAPEGASQFAAAESGPHPADVDVDTHLVKYTLVEYRQYVNGQSWSGMTRPQGALTLHKYTSNVHGCFLVQMTGTRTLTAEAFKGKSCASISGFDENAVMYER